MLRVLLPARPCLPGSVGASSTLKPNPGFILSLGETSWSVWALYLPRGKVALGFIYELDGKKIGKEGGWLLCPMPPALSVPPALSMPPADVTPAEPLRFPLLPPALQT